MTKRDDDNHELLRTVKRVLTDWRAVTWPDRGRTLRDSRGYPYACLTTHIRQGPVAVAAKKALFGGQASFMPRLVRQTDSKDAVLAILIGEDPTLSDGYAFDPARITKYGRERTVDSKQRDDVTVIDIDVSEHAIPLGEWFAGREDPPGVNQREPVGTLRDYGVGP